MVENEIYTIKKLKCAIKTCISVFYCDLRSFVIFLRSSKNVLAFMSDPSLGMAGDTNFNGGRTIHVGGGTKFGDKKHYQIRKNEEKRSNISKLLGCVASPAPMASLAM